ncbi:calcium-activated chloride channel regulator 4A-like [Lingula anatina]|uniref:Calcium-activated chloride channel regulator 4A-like n=1 Tax=Lingula anatina TaxID=7574 RepID=A0A1S3HGS5_LINAN|nr:calcium-activated chloride channel regulator 4A-like [Lingula anatina]|eukprot:XP_013384691.1 calcium-activated chloride channel regulator 4A-like [Lingula anatina]
MTIAASNFILNIAEEGSSIGIVTFSSTAQIVQSLVRLDSEADRTAVDAKLPTSASGGTCIGCGLLKGIEVLEQAGNASGGILKVISDGKENVVPFIAEVKPTILAKGVIADTILYTTAADDQLTSLAASTGGLSYYSTSDLNNAFIQPAMKRDPTYVQLYSSTFTLNPLSTAVDTITIDSSVGNNTRFSFSWTGGYSGISLTLTLPNGTNQTASGASGDTTIIMALPGKAEAGKYRFILENTGSRTSKEITGTVVSRATGGKNDLIHVSSQISASDVDFSDPASLYLIIYADVTRGYAPLVGATVTAIVEASGLGTFTQELKDTGSGADLSAGDGTYSAYFTKFSGNAKYTVMVKVEGGNTTKVKVNTAAKGQGAQAVDVENSGTQFQLTTVDDFSRSSSGGFFTVANQTAGSTVDLFPPLPVRDLRVTAMSYEMRTFTLEWTATGDDLDQGNASFYDLRMSRNYTALRSDFDSATPVLASQLAEGNLTSPLPAGQKEKIIILLKDLKDETTYFFALKVGDESGKNSSASNIVSSSFVEIKPESSHDNAGLIAGVVLAVVLVVIVVVVVLVYFLVIKKKHVKLQESEVSEKSGVDNPAYSKDKVKITNEKKNVNQKGATPATTAYGLNKVEMPTDDGSGSKPAKNGFSSKALNNPVPTAKKNQLPPLKPASTGKSGNLKSKPKK